MTQGPPPHVIKAFLRRCRDSACQPQRLMHAAPYGKPLPVVAQCFKKQRVLNSFQRQPTRGIASSTMYLGNCLCGERRVVIHCPEGHTDANLGRQDVRHECSSPAVSRLMFSLLADDGVCMLICMEGHMPPGPCSVQSSMGGGILQHATIV